MTQLFSRVAPDLMKWAFIVIMVRIAMLIIIIRHWLTLVLQLYGLEILGFYFWREF